jgi:hypothetical protein
MKKIVFLVLAFASFSSFACRPNIYAVRNNLVLKALEAVSESNDILGISGVALSKLQMAYVVRPANGLNCPDQYSAVVDVKLASKCFSVNVVSSAKAENELAEATEVECK